MQKTSFPRLSKDLVAYHAATAPNPANLSFSSESIFFLSSNTSRWLSSKRRATSAFNNPEVWSSSCRMPESMIPSPTRCSRSSRTYAINWTYAYLPPSRCWYCTASIFSNCIISPLFSIVKCTAFYSILLPVFIAFPASSISLSLGGESTGNRESMAGTAKFSGRHPHDAPDGSPP